MGNFFKDAFGYTAAGATGNFLGKLLHGNDPGQAQLAQVLELYGQAQGQLKQSGANALQYGKQALGAIDTGYTDAQNQIGRIGTASKAAQLDRQTQQLGGAQTSLQSRGLFNSSIYTNLERGIRSDTSRALGNIDEALAGLYSNLDEQKATAKAGAYGNLAGITQNQGSQQVSLTSNIAGAVAGVQHTDPNAWLGSLLQLGGTLGAAAISDRRLKDKLEIVSVGEDFNIYEFEYKQTPGVRWRGVMADEVAHIPGAVIRGSDGFDFVNYAKIGVRMERVG